MVMPSKRRRTFYDRQVQAFVVNHDGSTYELPCEDVLVSPIGVDIDNSGSVKRMDGFFSFDLDGTGEPQVLGEWFDSTEGILVDSSVAGFPGEMSGQHLFGDMGGLYKDGFAKLSSLRDYNKDGVISGDELQGLMIWRDANSDGKADGDEIFPLSKFKITEISTSHSKFVSFATLSDGSRMETEDLWFVEPKQE